MDSLSVRTPLTPVSALHALTGGCCPHSGIVANNLGIGAGITSTLVALIANAGPEDQAVATAVSYLFRSLGSVVGLSVGTTLTQEVLRQSLRKRLPGENVDEVCLLLHCVILSPIS